MGAFMSRYSITAFCLTALLLPFLGLGCVASENDNTSHNVGVVRAQEEFLPVKVEVMHNEKFVRDEEIWHRYLLDLQNVLFTYELAIEKYLPGAGIQGYSVDDSDLKEGRNLMIGYRARAQIFYYPILYLEDHGRYLLVDSEERNSYRDAYENYQVYREKYDKIDEDIVDINEFLAKEEWTASDVETASRTFFSSERSSDWAEEFLGRFRGLQIRNPWLVKSYRFSERIGQPMVIGVVQEIDCPRVIDELPVRLIFVEEEEKWRIFVPDMD